MRLTSRPVGLPVVASLATACTPDSWEDPPGEEWVAVAAGDHNLSCALDQSGEIACWGFDARRGGAPPEGSFSALSVGLEACGLRADGDAVCGERSRSHGASDQPGRIPGPWTAIAGGRDDLCGLAADGAVACVGSGDHDRLPSGVGFTSIDKFENVGCAVGADGSVACWDDAWEGDIDPRISTIPEGSFVSVDVGGGKVCALDAGGGVTCWGAFEWWGDVPPYTFRQVSSGAHVSCGVTSVGTVACWGLDNAIRPSFAGGTGWVAVAVGTVQACALHEEGHIDCFETPDVEE